MAAKPILQMRAISMQLVDGLSLLPPFRNFDRYLEAAAHRAALEGCTPHWRPPSFDGSLATLAHTSG